MADGKVAFLLQPKQPIQSAAAAPKNTRNMQQCLYLQDLVGRRKSYVYFFLLFVLFCNAKMSAAIQTRRFPEEHEECNADKVFDEIMILRVPHQQ